jgi:two-component system, OmpR family, sensor histidine kinase CpxA
VRIFTRIFASFWVTVIVMIGVAALLIVPFSFMQANRPRLLRIYPLRLCSLATLDEYQRGGRDALAQYLTTSAGNCSSGIIINLNGKRQLPDLGLRLALAESIFGKPSPEIVNVAVRELPLHSVVAFPRALGHNGQTVSLFMHPPFVLLLNSPLPPYTLVLYLIARIALLAAVSGLCCYLLTLYLVKPVTRLGRMAEQLGEGNLGTRIDGSLAARTDELGDLGRKFNQMAGEIESLVKRYKDFLAHASHELGSPLTRVNIALALARQKVDPTLHPELDRIGQETNRLNTLVQELLLLARLESGNELSRQTTSFDVAEVVEEACADANFEATQIGKSIILKNRETFRVTGHRELLRRSLDNVLRNGLRFAQAAGSVQVDMRSHPANKEGVISICDDGPGIGAKQEEVIFEPFVTLQDRVADQSNGSGLGLAIARQAVRANGGRIFASNTDAGGLTITIKLPLDDAELCGDSLNNTLKLQASS